MNYENGLKILEAFVKAEDTKTRDDFAFAKTEFLELLDEERLFGANTSARRNKILRYQLIPLATRFILSQSPVENGLDYVLLQVDNRITQINGIQPAPYELSQPTKGMGVHILQHPQGDTMKLAINDNGITGIYQSDGLIQYVTRALGGSSGAPCFNEEWQVVALHHAERAKSFGRIREGILFSAIYDNF
jgi:hypothetical protein